MSAPAAMVVTRGDVLGLSLLEFVLVAGLAGGVAYVTTNERDDRLRNGLVVGVAAGLVNVAQHYVARTRAAQVSAMAAAPVDPAVSATA